MTSLVICTPITLVRQRDLFIRWRLFVPLIHLQIQIQLGVDAFTDCILDALGVREVHHFVLSRPAVQVILVLLFLHGLAFLDHDV